MTSFIWQVGTHHIPFLIGTDCAEAVARKLGELEADRLLVISDENVLRLHSQRYEPVLQKAHVTGWPGSEMDKNLAAVESLASQLIVAGVTRRSILIAMGGGVLGNLTGLTAALLFRGIRFVHLPTTLLAMHDSVTSLKQGVNCAGAKNIIGGYHAPTAVFVDTAFLQTLPSAQIRSGLTELVKNALILGGDYAAQLSAALGEPEMDWLGIIQLGIAAKQSLMRDDPHERSAALALEYGHTIGHALELSCGGQLSHGDCVAWGMRCAAWISRDLGYMNESGLERHESWLDRLGELPRPRELADMDEVRRRIRLDNKRGYLPVGADEVAMVLLREPGLVMNAECGVPLTAVRMAAVERMLGCLGRAWQMEQ
jgi:3-dehydroquinate synthase